MKNLLALFILLFSLSNFSQAQSQCGESCSHDCCNIDSWNMLRPDGIAPVGVMGDHYHHQKGWMVSYSFMHMNMDQNYQGTNKISTSEIHERYMVAPQDMNMQMHMVGLMYAFTDKFTVMGMLPVIENNMNLVSRNGMQFSTSSNGIGDAKLSFIYGLKRINKQSFQLNAGLILPTGSVTERDNTPMQEGAKLPYPMQIGSGTWGSSFGLTYTGQATDFSWGAQPMVYLRHGENSEDYRFGNQYRLNAWFAYRINNWFSTSFRADGFANESINGQDVELNPMMVSTADINNSGNKGVNGSLGVNFFVPHGSLQGLRFGLEYGRVLFADMEGIQMRMNDSWTLGAKIDF